MLSMQMDGMSTALCMCVCVCICMYVGSFEEGCYVVRHVTDGWDEHSLVCVCMYVCICVYIYIRVFCSFKECHYVVHADGWNEHSLVCVCVCMCV